MSEIVEKRDDDELQWYPNEIDDIEGVQEVVGDYCEYLIAIALDALEEYYDESFNNDSYLAPSRSDWINFPSGD